MRMGSLVLAVFLSQAFAALSLAQEPLRGLSLGQWDVSEVEDLLTRSRLELLQKSTVALVRTSEFNQSEFRTWEQAHHFCRKEKFAQERLWSYCSGVLISPRHVLTASHCIRDIQDCQDIQILFDYTSDSQIETIKTSSQLVRRCRKVVKFKSPSQSKSQHDLAVLELQKDVKERPFIEVTRIPRELKAAETIVAIGHPGGLSSKISVGWGSGVREGSYEIAAMLAYAGLSGSPVLNSDGELTGILVRGGPTVEYEDGVRPRCSYQVPCTLSSCPWAHVQRLDPLFSKRGRK